MISKHTNKIAYFYLLIFVLFSHLVLAGPLASSPPDSIELALKKIFPDATDLKWERKDATYVASFQAENTKMKASFDTKGNLLEKESEIEVSSLPTTVKLFIETQDEGAKILKASKIEQANSNVVYDVTIKSDNKKTRLTISKDGFLTSR
jgi:uncharacterized membrane protein YkoI